MKLVIAGRHGTYGSQSLTDHGRVEAATLGKEISSRVSGVGSVALVSSPLVRATETAAIIGLALGIGHRECEILRRDLYFYGNDQMEAILELVAGFDVVVAVTHHEAPSGIINAFRQKHFGKKFQMREIQKGSGLVLCLDTGEISEIP